LADALVESAIAHWAPRFIQNGVDYNDFVATTARIDRWDDWLAEWSATADQAAGLAAEAQARGHRLTAGRQWLRAAVTRHFGKFVWLVDPELHADATLTAVQELLMAHRLLETGAERIEAPLSGSQVVANLRRPAGAARPALVVLVPGLDSTKEEFFQLEQTFLERGMATASLDGAGQGEVGLRLPIRHDYEACIAALLDKLASRDDLDLARVGVFGVSLGGYYAPRAAAFEPRIRAVIGLSGPFDWGALWDQLPRLTKLAFTAKSGATNEADARERAAALDLSGVCERITVPALFATGTLDRVVPSAQTEAIARNTPGASFVLFEGGNHTCANVSALARPTLADWMRDRLLTGSSLTP
jgi:2,6-dihydroxypseudooxynicotine hydrolase